MGGRIPACVVGGYRSIVCLYAYIIYAWATIWLFANKLPSIIIRHQNIFIYFCVYKTQKTYFGYDFYLADDEVKLSDGKDSSVSFASQYWFTNGNVYFKLASLCFCFWIFIRRWLMITWGKLEDYSGSLEPIRDSIYRPKIYR